MNKDENVVGSIFADVEKIVRKQARIERDAVSNVATSGVAQLRHKYASSVCKTVLNDVKCLKNRYMVDADGAMRTPSHPVLPGALPHGEPRLAELIREANWNITLEESYEMAEYLLSQGALIPMRCRDCKHGQQCAELGVICEYNQDEYRPYDSYCSFAERRTFDEDNEEHEADT